MPVRLTPGAARARHLVVLLLLWAVCGALLGVAWFALWEPPVGQAYEGQWFLTREGLDQDASATALFALLGVAGGLLLGVLTAVWGRDRELVTLGAACVGSVLAAWLMFQVGHALGPPDPREVAVGAAPLQEIPADLRLAGADADPWPLWFESSAFSALPGGALLGIVGVLLSSGTSGSARPRSRAARG
ncbi:hypothetical protein [Nocardioides solisilvae]|uniref:hypothetical protein n=1 Tax=Nocardioides solisilvae TaxID=1542435 RepID=UPI000D74303A|nr:hypothetical protein [Nocardioides solisilvae]